MIYLVYIVPVYIETKSSISYEEVLSKTDHLPSKVSLTHFFEVLRC